MTWPAGLLYFLSGYSATGEIIGHAIIAVNRYFALKNAQISEHQWSTRTTKILSASIFIIPFLFCACRIPQEVRYKFPVNDGFPSIVYTNPVFSQIMSLANIGLYLVCFIPSFIASIIALWNYRKIRKQNNIKSASTKQELKLFCKFSTFEKFVIKYLTKS
uniref:7TM GPCR serpentine receptor class x (Srx) domain-containing protein n=1 Tax=Panagrolaimus davidi TaxID=227884 RepID=A0A914QC87_9BILA